MSQNFRLETPSGAMLHGLIDYPEDLPTDPADRSASDPRYPAIVICHGFKGFMEWGFFPYLAELCARRGFVVVRFNFSGSGMVPGQDRATDLQGFRDNTYLKELADLEVVLEAVGETIAAGWVDRGRLGLFGHSRGGGMALLAASRSPWRERLKALVTWAAVANFDRFSEEDKSRWRREGEITVTNARTGQEMPLGLGLLEELETHRDELDLAAAAGRRQAPWLIVHGGDDEAVPAVEAGRLASHAAAPVELHEVSGAGHTFGARHPFAGPTPHLIEAMNVTQTWFRRYLTAS